MRGWSALEAVAWTSPLTDEEVADAEITDNRIAFRKEGNPWLACIQRNDILWSPLASDARLQFLRRVLEITDADDRIVFQTRSAGLTELFRRASIRVGGADSTRR